MKPTPEQTQNAVLGFFRYDAIDDSLESVSAPGTTAVDPLLTYGCVDWYIYPDEKAESVAASFSGVDHRV